MLDEPAGVRCTASLPATLEPGEPLDLVFTLENTTSEPLDVSVSQDSYGTLVEAADGSTWDPPGFVHSYPVVLPRRLDPGEETTVRPELLNVQFPGPVTVIPTCLRQKLPPLEVAVDGAGSVPSPAEAINLAAAQTSGLFDRCMPRADASTVGSIDPPRDSGLKPMEARCSADVNSFPGFAIVTFMIVSSPDGPAI